MVLACCAWVKCNWLYNALSVYVLCITLSLLPLRHTNNQGCLFFCSFFPNIYCQCYVKLSNILNWYCIHGWVMVTTKALLVASGGTIFFTVTVTALVAFVPHWTKTGNVVGSNFSWTPNQKIMLMKVLMDSLQYTDTVTMNLMHKSHQY